MKDYPVMAGRILRTSAHAILVPQIKKNIRDQEQVFTGQLFQRVDARSIVDGEKIGIEVGAIGVPYGMAVERGQPRGTKQNVSKLIRYAERKFGLKGAAAARVGIRLAEKIERKGTKGKPFVQPAFEDTRRVLVNDFVTRARRRLAS